MVALLAFTLAGARIGRLEADAIVGAGAAVGAVRRLACRPREWRLTDTLCAVVMRVDDARAASGARRLW